MTTDYTIQQQNPAPSKLPYVATGAVAGGLVGGLGLPKWTGKVKTVEDIIAETNDKDQFVKNTAEGAENKASWEEVNELAKKVKEAEAKLDEASKPKLDTNLAEAKELEAAQEAFDNASKKTSVTTKTVAGKTEILPYSTEWRMTPKEAAEYKTFYGDYLVAKSNFESDPKTISLNNAISNRESLMDKVITSVEVDAATTINKSGGTRRKLKNAPTNLAEYVENGYAKDAFANAIESNDFVRLNDTEIINLVGGEKNLKPSKPLFGGGNYIEVTKQNGTKAFAELDKKQMKKYSNMLDSRIDEAANRMAENYERVVEIRSALGNENAMEKLLKFDKGLIKNAGTTRDKVVEDIEKWIGDKTVYVADKKAIENAGLQAVGKKKTPGVTVSYDKTIEDIMTRHGVSSPQEAYELLSARIHMIDKKAATESALREELESLIPDKVLKNLRKQLENHENSDKSLRIARSKMNRYSRFFQKSKTTETVTSEGSTKEVPQAIKDRLELAKEKYDAAAKKSGQIDTAAKEAAEKDLAAAKESLSKKAEELASKLGKSGGMNKWLSAAIGIVALGGLGALIAPKKGKETV